MREVIQCAREGGMKAVKGGLVVVVLMVTVWMVYWTDGRSAVETFMVSITSQTNSSTRPVHPLHTANNLPTTPTNNSNNQNNIKNNNKKINNNNDNQNNNNAINQSHTSPLIHVSIKTVYDRFKPRTLESCPNTCSQNDTFCNPLSVDKPTWDRTVATHKDLKVIPLFSPQEYVMPWEKDYLGGQRFSDSKSLPNLSKTKISFLGFGQIVHKDFVEVKRRETGEPYGAVGLGDEGRRKENGVRIPCELGDTLTFRVDLFDGYGQARVGGGDDVRGWLSSKRLAHDARDAKGYGAAGRVLDAGNGTYFVTVTAVWKGLAKLNVAMVYPREYIAMALNHSRMGTHRFILGLFKNGSAQEATICHPTPNIPGRPCVCNFTDINGVPYFCGRPLNPVLSCKHWQSVWPTYGVPYKHFNSEEKKLADDMARPMRDSLIPNKITLIANGTGNMEDQIPACPNGCNYSITWTAQSPRGYWSNGNIWKSLVCKELSVTSSHALRCLANHRVLIVGDSNGVRLKGGVQKLIPSRVTRSGSWPFRSTNYNQDHNITILFRPHEYPLFLQHKWMPYLNYGGAAEEIDAISSHDKYVIILHYYFHLSAAHLSTLFTRLDVIKGALKRLIERNPNGAIAVRGPHLATVAWEQNHMFSGDVLGKQIIRIYREVFYELRDRVIYLDGWDMSLGIENEGVHPSDLLPQAMIRTLVALKCSV